MSAVDTKLNAVFSRNAPFAFVHDGGNANGSTPVARPYSPAKSDAHGTFFPSAFVYPFTAAYDSRSVKVASGYSFAPYTPNRACAIRDALDACTASTLS